MPVQAITEVRTQRYGGRRRRPSRALRMLGTIATALGIQRPVAALALFVTVSFGGV